MPTLSICIPTHHGRAEVLDRLLDVLRGELVPGVRERVEVCVSDNGSHDATQAVLARQREDYPVALVTHRFERNDGFRPNLLKVVEIASSDFCWLLGSDDLLAPGAVREVLDTLDAHPDVAGMSLNRYRVNVFDPGTKLHDPPDELPEDPERLHVYTDAHDAFVNTGLAQDFISTQVFDRRLWGEVVDEAADPRYAQDKLLVHLMLLGRIIQRRPKWIWHPAPLVHHTTGTSALDEELDHDYTAFQLAIMEGRDAVWSTLFGRGSRTYRAVMAKAYRRSARPAQVIELKLAANHDHRSDLALLRSYTRWFSWHRPFLTRSLPVLLIPHTVLKGLRRAKAAGMRRVAARA